MGESGTTACPGLWMAIPGICCHVEGMRICCVPAGQPCCTHTETHVKIMHFSKILNLRCQRFFLENHTEIKGTVNTCKHSHLCPSSRHPADPDTTCILVPDSMCYCSEGNVLQVIISKISVSFPGGTYGYYKQKSQVCVWIQTTSKKDPNNVACVALIFLFLDLHLFLKFDCL